MLNVFEAAVAADPAGPMVAYFDRVLSARDVDEQAEALAVHLQRSGLVTGDRVVLCLQNVPQYLIALIAAWKAGCIVVPANPMLRERELLDLLEDSGAAAIVILDELVAGCASALEDAPSLSTVVTTSALDYQSRNDARVFGAGARVGVGVGDDLARIVERHRGERVDRTVIGPDDPAVITYTSGTTGRPKGAINTHDNVVAGGRMYLDWFRLGPNDAILALAPLFHVTGLSGHIAAALTARVPLVMFYRFSPEVVAEAVEEHTATFTVGAITAFISLANTPGIRPESLASLRVVGSGGAPIAPATAEQVEAALGFYPHNLYGMTETTAPVLAVPVGTTAPVDPASGALAAGVPVHPDSIRVVDDEGRDLGPGEPGELLVRGPSVIPGYWERPEATREAFVGEYLRTGDVGFYDEDGWYYIVDRLKDMIIASGYKVWPRDVEDVLYGHPDVLEVVVVGVPHPYRGESVKAFVTLKPGAAVTAPELIEFARERMAAYKYPREVEIVSEIPRTATGKLLRRAMRR